MNKRKIIRDQMDHKIILLKDADQVVTPPSGWIYSIRQGINMSLRQLSRRLSITPQSVKEMEVREKNGTISLKLLKQVASALDMNFVYGFVPKDKTLEKMIERRARELARSIVERTSIQMNLEDQKVSEERINRAIEEKATELKNEMPKILWD